MKAETNVVYTSHWEKGNLSCTVHSERKSGDRTARFWFTGYNPFPCFYMVSTATCITRWLRENGWVQNHNSRVSYTTDTIDEWGDTIDHSVTVYYMPV